MNVGIKSYGAYIPKYLVRREDIAKAWDFPSVPGTKAVANADEDSLTMAVEAGLDCLKGIDGSTIDGLIFATTTPPFLEKSSASIIAAALDLRDDIITMDITDSLRAGTTGLCMAADLVETGRAGNMLVIAADKRNPEPATTYEFSFGDAAAALLVSADAPALQIIDHVSRTEDLIDTWRRDKDTFIRQFSAKYEDVAGYEYNMIAAIKALAAKTGTDLATVGKACIHGSDPRAPTGIAKKAGMSPKAAWDNGWQMIGDIGTPQVFMTLISAMKRPKDGELVVLAGYGDGADAILMQVANKQMLKDLKRSRRGFMINIATAEPVPEYTRYIQFRNSLNKEPFKRRTSPVQMHREAKFITRFHGARCTACGTVQYPIGRSCVEPNCMATGQLEEVKLEKHGKIFTFVLDHLEGGEYSETPIPRCVIDLEGGGRVLLNMTDCNPKDVAIDMDAELTFRKVHEGSEFYNYYWKCRPVRQPAGGAIEDDEGAAPKHEEPAPAEEA
jgi:3-hydroxy-3-methylglutaryl CoA synthase